MINGVINKPWTEVMIHGFIEYQWTEWMLVNKLIDWLTDWLMEWLIDWLIDSMNDRLFYEITEWNIADWIIDEFNKGMKIEWWIDWMEWLTDWLIDKSIKFLASVAKLIPPLEKLPQSLPQ